MNTHNLRRTRHPVKVYLSRSIVLLFAVVLALTITSQDLEASSRATVVQQQDRLKDPTFISDGARLFAPSCGNAYCHGTKGAGGGAPRLRGRELDAAYLFKTISNGIPGTGMLSFKTELSEDRIWKLVAFIMSDPKSDPAVKAPVSGRVSSISRAESGNSAPTIAASSLIGDPQAGRALFFDSTQVKSCQSCHSFSGEGKPIGPDLSSLEKKSPRELFLNIVLVGESKDPRYATVTVTLKN
ncbi:MAG: c-type cytochrome, partial [Blastocatellia bacterium]